jgi:formyltetrahydrofolate-dependent phosphoribosylglycinamide formyltransferase
MPIKKMITFLNRFLIIIMQFCPMLKKLQENWKVDGKNLILILISFAIGGSVCARLGEKIIAMFQLEKSFLWYFLYLIIVTILWPICVVVISIPFGQFVFFKSYVKKLFYKLLGKKNSNTNISIFASGAGSNAKNIINFLKNNPSIKVALIVCNKPNAGVVEIAKSNNIPILLIKNEDLSNPASLMKVLKKHHIQWIILAGFLKKIPSEILNLYQQKVINIHPALLPKYGGAGMYGSKVHASVIANQEKESGITIHFVDEIYDHGEIIFQKNVALDSNENVESLANKIHQLEHAYFPSVILDVIQKQNQR